VRLEMNLGEHFSDKDKAQFVERTLRPSNVIKLFCETTRPPKEKRLVIAGINPELLVFIINSEMPRFYANKPYLKIQQIPLEKQKENFLDHDSWLDCSEVFREFTVEKVREILLADTSRHLGKLSDEVVARIMDVVSESETLEQRHINRIISDIS
jgi:hypothetical protein